MNRFAAGVVGLLAVAAAARANSPDPGSLAVPPEKVSRARELVRQLGSEAYRDRDRATRELRRMGRLAATVLADVTATEADPEVRSRCEELLTAAEADDVAARVAAFLTDADGRYDHDLPGWAEFRAAAGDDTFARTLFAAVLKNPANYPVLLACRRPGERLDRALAARRQQLQYRPGTAAPVGRFGVEPEPPAPLELPDVAVLLLAESVRPTRAVPLAPVPGEFQLTSFFFSTRAKDAVAGHGPFGPAFRRLAVRWLETRDERSAVMMMYFARNISIGTDVVNRLAARVLTLNPGDAANKVGALTVLTQNGGKEQLPAVANLFADATTVDKGLPNTASPDDLQLRDAALLTAVKLTGQNPKDYGLEPPPVVAATEGIPPPAVNPANPYALRFRPTGPEADRKREAAFKKWDAWAAEHLKNGKPAEAKP